MSPTDEKTRFYGVYLAVVTDDATGSIEVVDTLVANSVVSASDSPGVGNIW